MLLKIPNELDIQEDKPYTNLTLYTLIKALMSVIKERTILDTLLYSLTIIDQWHGTDEETFKLYYENAPEMKPISKLITFNQYLLYKKIRYALNYEKGNKEKCNLTKLNK